MRPELYAPEPLQRLSKLDAIVRVPRKLATVMEELYESDIACFVRVERRIEVRLGRDTRVKVHASFRVGNSGAAARWLRRNAIRLYPQSAYASRHRDRFSVIALLAALWRPF